MNPAGQQPTAAASSAPRPAAKRRLETGTVSLEFLLGGGGGVDVPACTCTDNFLVLQKHRGLHMQ